MAPELAWLIPGFPFLAFLVNVFLTRRNAKLSGYVAILGVGSSFALSVMFLLAILGSDHALAASFLWLPLGHEGLRLGVVVDPLAATMLIVVTSVSLLVHIYSQGYMHGDPDYSRFFANLSLFTTSMLGLVLADNLVMLYAFWELVGLCSYLLIGFWFFKPEAAAAAKKAFIVTRLGDLGMLLGILYLFWNAGTVNFIELEHKAAALSATVLTLGAIGLFCGAVGKSAQFPLHVWLPDAMEGPTPVSALIHAATMVAAGVYLVARAYPIFEHSAQAMQTVAIIGGITAIFAASMGVVMFDIKRVLAYSTVSQLGLMMLALGVGGFVAGVFHLFNHAFFKALLFLGSGSVIHGSGTQDMREMGGLKKFMPITYWTFMIASLSIAGIFPLSGFWSKDEILGDAWKHGETALFFVALAASFLTAFYMFRLMFMTFHGEHRGIAATADSHAAAPAAGHDSHDAHVSHDAHDAPGDGHASDSHGGGHGKPHESPLTMTLPLMILAVPSIFSGLLNANGGFGHFIAPQEHFAGVDLFIAGISTVNAVAAIGLAYVIYGARWISAETLGKIFAPIRQLLFHKYYMDELYEGFVKYVVMPVCAILQWVDRAIVDGVVDGVAALTVGTGSILRKLETGRLQSYALVIFVGILFMLAGYALSLPPTN